jgi:molybdenum cofactor cytidylyltransferase
MMTAAIILAAGESRRLGQPKQNLVFQHKTLLERSVEAALGAGCAPVMVILGANSAHIAIHADENVKLIYNPDWREGMASSIRSGINELHVLSGIDSVVIMLCDQPFADRELIHALRARQTETGKAIIACSYGTTIGVPALFARSLFPELLRLKGDEGARLIFKARAAEVIVVPFAKGGIDIDTAEDYDRLTGLSD